MYHISNGYCNNLGLGPLPDKVIHANQNPRLGLQQSISFMKQAIVLSGRASRKLFKSAVDICVAKHVSRAQICGKWRIEQQVELRRGVIISSPATIILLENNTLVAQFDGRTFRTKFVFIERYIHCAFPVVT